MTDFFRLAAAMGRPIDRNGGETLSSLLVAEGDADLRQRLARILGERYDTRIVADCEAALAAARDRRPDLILADIATPGLDRIGLLRALRVDDALKTVPLILLYFARAGEERRLEGMLEAADDYVLKPFSDRELLARVRVHIDLARLRRQSESTLRENEARFRALAEASSDVIFRISADGTQMLTLLGRDFVPDTQEPSPSWVQKYIAPDDRSQFMAAVERAIRTKSVFDLEHRYLPVGGGLGWAHSRVVPILDASGEIAEWFGMASDITPRKRAEEALSEADRQKDEFLAMLAHELRNPLAPIRTGLDMLRLGVDAATAARVRDTMARQVDHLVRLVDDLLDASRFSRGLIRIRKERIDAAQVVNDAVAGNQPLMTERSHLLKVSLPPEPLPLDADPTRLLQVVNNLLGNAAIFTPSGGSIEVCARREGAEAVVSVRDNGAGIPADKLNAVFGFFTRLHDGLDHGGLGVGLAMARDIVELHGGRVEARSGGPGQGSEFVVFLPLADSRVGEAPGRTERQAPANAARRRVLVVDDSRDIADMFAQLLETLDVEVSVAYDGPSALEIVAAFKPEVAFLDIGMPVMDGCETARRIRALPEGRDIRLIALTGWAQDKDRRRTREAGFDMHLVKPVNFEQVTALLWEPGE